MPLPGPIPSPPRGKEPHKKGAVAGRCMQQTPEHACPELGRSPVSTFLLDAVAAPGPGGQPTRSWEAAAQLFLLMFSCPGTNWPPAWQVWPSQAAGREADSWQGRWGNGRAQGNAHLAQPAFYNLPGKLHRLVMMLEPLGAAFNLDSLRFFPLGLPKPCLPLTALVSQPAFGTVPSRASGSLLQAAPRSHLRHLHLDLPRDNASKTPSRPLRSQPLTLGCYLLKWLGEKGRVAL